MDINDDLAECLQKLFLESEEISLRIGGYFTTTRKNRGIVVNNHQYYFKSESKNKDTRWVCNKYQCSASITTNLDGKIIKINGKQSEIPDLKHDHESYTCEEIKALFIYLFGYF